MKNLNDPITSDRLFALNEKLRDLVREKALGDIDKKNDKAFFLAFALAKGSKTHEAILVLCKNYFGEDAFILGRSLVELTVITSYILKDKTRGRLDRYVEHDSIVRKKMYQYLLSKKQLREDIDRSTGSPENTDKLIKDIETDFEQAQLKHEYDWVGWSDMRWPEMFAEMGRADAYHNIYKPMCSLAHSNVRSANEYIKIENNVHVVVIGPSPNHIQMSLVAAYDFFYKLTEMLNEEFGWNIQDKLAELTSEFLLINQQNDKA